MKFCFFGYDHSFDVMKRLIDDGHELLHVFSFKCDGIYSFNKDLETYCRQNAIPFTIGKITTENISTLINNKCKLFLACGYSYKIPPIDESKAYGVNIHPTLLPKARGKMPQPYIILNEPEAAGFTIHKLTQDYDAGDILFQMPIPVDETTDIETLAARIAIHIPEQASTIIKDIENYWNNSTPQAHDKATYYDEPDITLRSLNWNDSVDILLLKSRAFGRFGVFANITNKFGESQNLAVFQFNGWKEYHNHNPGTLIRAFPREITVAVKDGYICLKDFTAISSN